MKINGACANNLTFTKIISKMPMAKYRVKREPLPADETTQPEPVESKRGCKDISMEAKNRNHWIYDPSSKKWYTPEEFMELNERIVTGNEQYLSQVKIMDPLDGIKAGYVRLLDTQIKLEDFTK